MASVESIEPFYFPPTAKLLSVTLPYHVLYGTLLTLVRPSPSSCLSSYPLPSATASPSINRHNTSNNRYLYNIPVLYSHSSLRFTFTSAATFTLRGTITVYCTATAAPGKVLMDMHALVSGVPAPSCLPSFYPFISSLSLFLSNPTIIAILLTLTLVPLVLWIDTIGKDPASSFNKMAIKDPSGDFKGNIKVNNNPPTKGDLEQAADLSVLDRDGKKHTFKSLYADNENGPRRVLIIFIRHFFCGACTPITFSSRRQTLTQIHRIARSTSGPSHPPSPPSPSPPSPRPQKSSSSAAANRTSYRCTSKKQDAPFPFSRTPSGNYITSSA